MLTAEVGANRGDDALPYSRDELRGKFMQLCTRVWDDTHCERLLSATLDLAGDCQGGRPAMLAWSNWCELLVRPPRVRQA